MEKTFKNFFENKTILITGHTGFIGSWMAIWLNELGANVIGYALEPHTQYDNYVVTKLEDKITSIIADIRDYDKLKNVMKKYKPQIVFHLAAQPIVRLSYIKPKVTYDINVGGTVNVFEAFRKNGYSKVLINMTTDKCYENQERLEGYCEEDRLGGYDPYSSSKACSELVTTAYRNLFFNSTNNEYKKIVSSVRCGNIIGGGDWQQDRLIPDCMRALRNNEELLIRNPKSIRPWQFVLEPIRGILMLAKKMWKMDYNFSGAWNFGPSDNSIYSVIEIIERIHNYVGNGKYKLLNQEETDSLHETKVLMLNCNKSRKKLKWQPITNIDDTISYICDWYIEQHINYEFDVSQICKYIESINKFSGE